MKCAKIKQKGVNTMYVENFANRLKEARKRIGYTQEQVAATLEISRTNITNYELGRTQPDIETLGKLIDLYEISADWVIGTGITKR